MSQRAVGEPRSGIPARRGAPDAGNRLALSRSFRLFDQTKNKTRSICLFRNPTRLPPLPLTLPFPRESTDQDKISDFELKLMDIDSEHLGIPDTEYKCQIKMCAPQRDCG